MKRRLNTTANLWLHVLIFLLCFGSVYGQEVHDKSSTHPENEIREDDTLIGNVQHFERVEFTKLAESTNVNRFNNSQQFSIGQILKNSNMAMSFKDSSLALQDLLSTIMSQSDTLKNQRRDTVKVSVEPDTSSSEILEEFRSVFESLVKQEKSQDEEQVKVEVEQQILLEIDGMVIDETRSKVGRDFYDVFYQHWEPPSNASRYTITISELPAPGLGTVIYVKVNDTETFRYRLQPRYDFIQEAGRYAVSLTYQYLRDEQRELIIY